MWRRLQIASTWRSAHALHRSRAAAAAAAASVRGGTLTSTSSLLRSFSRAFSAEAERVVESKTVEDVMPIATGHEREEIEAELEGRKRFDMDAPSGPFGTKEAPAMIQSCYDKRIVGCPGGVGEDEHEVVWFWLEKGKPYECPVCSQYFKLEVIGAGGPPGGHGDEDEH